MVKIVSFNINGLRARLHQLERLVAVHAPAVIALQETKVADAEFPAAQVRDLGYEAVWHGQKGHYGVALLSTEPLRAVEKGYPDEEPGADRRLLAGRYPLANGELLTVVNAYVPQGEGRSHPVKFPAKRRFYADLLRLLEDRFSPRDKLVVLGDFNVAPADADVGIGDENARRWLRTGKCGFLPEERQWLQQLIEWGLVDTLRVRYPDADDLFSWFDYRSRGFERDPRRGLRIDLLLASRTLSQSLVDAGIDDSIRGMERPSDHCPVWASLAV